jgi:hypothetical protein
MKQFTKFVGLDVHKATIAVSVAECGGEVRYLGEIANTAEAITKLVRQLTQSVFVRGLYTYQRLLRPTPRCP